MLNRKIIAPLAVVTALMASTAMADVTAQQVWDDWKSNVSLYGDNGITIGSEVAGPGTVTVTDLAIAMEDDDVAISANMPSIVLTENGDGTVSVTMSDEYPIDIYIKDWQGERTSHIGLMLRQTGATTRVSGAPEAITYDISAQRYAVEITDFVEFGDALPVEGYFALNNLSGSYTSHPGDIRGLTYSFNAATVDMLFDVDAPEDEAVISIAGQIANLTLNADMVVPAHLIENPNPDTIDLTGLSVSGGYAFDGMAYTADVDVDGEQLQGTVTAAEGTLDFAFSEAGVSYDTLLRGLAISAPVVPEFPLPIDVGIAEYSMGFAMPLSRTDAPAAVRSSINLTGLTINDALWSMVDPSGQLDHSPITVQMAVTGQMKWLFDLLDPMQQQEMARSDMPAEIYGLTIDTLNVAALGATVTGDGAFTFDNTDLATIPGVPRPEGQASIVVTGANALMDKLVSMGLIAEQDLMAPRMMMGMFATATGNDQLSSNVEIRSDGSVFVNGQQVM